MNRIWQMLLGIEPSSPGVVTGGDSRLEFAVAAARDRRRRADRGRRSCFSALLWRLYRWERRELSPAKRALLVGLRMLTLLAAAIMLLEPVLVSTRRETVPSHLMIVVDDSESMKFSDPYTDNSRAVDLAASLKLESAAGKSPVDRLRETPRLDLVKKVMGPNLEALARGRELFVYNLESAAQPGGGASARTRKLDDIQANRAYSPLGDALHGVLAAHRGQPVAGVILATDGRSNTGEDPLRAVEAAARQNIPIFSIAAGADEGPRNIRLAEIEVSPVVFVRDPMMLAVVVEARGLRDAEATIVLEQRINDGAWEGLGSQRVVLGEDGILKRTSFRLTPRVVGQYEYRARVEDAGPELTQDDNVATAAVRVVRQQIRVLLIAGAASPEVQFLTQCAHARPARRVRRLDPARRSGLSPARRPPDPAAAQQRCRAAPV